MAVAVLAIAAAGCSNDDKPHAKGADASSSEEASASPAKPADVRKGPTTFSDPTGNIGCALDETSVRCDVAKHTWKPPKKPTSCDLDFGQGVTIEGENEATFVCAGDTTLGAKKVLKVHEAVQVGVFGCRTDPNAVVCSNEDSGHGFTISRGSYDLY
jgi:hypothetical protein